MKKNNQMFQGFSCPEKNARKSPRLLPLLLLLASLSLTACQGSQGTQSRVEGQSSTVKDVLSERAQESETSTSSVAQTAKESYSNAESLDMERETDSSSAPEEEASSAPEEVPFAPSQTNALTEEAPQSPFIGQVDIDLTRLSSTMVYSEVFTMMTSPDNYLGKTIRMRGNATSFTDPNTGITYHACIIKDATACCAQGIEFLLAGDSPVYPQQDELITVTGVFELYQEGENLYCRLQDAVLES